MPPTLLPERWALTPPFHPYRRSAPKKMSRRFSFELSPGAHRRRYSLCGTVRNVFPGAALRRLGTNWNDAPWRYQAHCPSPLAQMRCPDFPPVPLLAQKNQRLSSPPAKLIIARDLAQRRSLYVPPVNASTPLLRATPHDSEPVQVASPSPCDSFIHYISLVLTGAQGAEHVDYRRRLSPELSANRFFDSANRWMR